MAHIDRGSPREQRRQSEDELLQTEKLFSFLQVQKVMFKQMVKQLCSQRQNIWLLKMNLSSKVWSKQQHKLSYLIFSKIWWKKVKINILRVLFCSSLVLLAHDVVKVTTIDQHVCNGAVWHFFNQRLQRDNTYRVCIAALTWWHEASKTTHTVVNHTLIFYTEQFSSYCRTGHFGFVLPHYKNTQCIIYLYRCLFLQLILVIFAQFLRQPFLKLLPC